MDLITDTLPEMPRMPEEWECCGSWCGDSCVYEIYRREKEEYMEQMRMIAELKGEKGSQ